MSVYEEKMPAYLAMSRGDLIAEVLEAVDTYGKWFQHHIENDHNTAITTEASDARERVRVANDVLTERFGISVLVTNPDLDHFEGDF